VSYSFGLMIESLVAALLLLTIGYCVILNRRLKRLKADEQSLKATISELITATEIAGRAVAGLKATAHDCDRTLGERLRAAERLSAEMDRQIKAGEVIRNRLAVIEAAAPPPAAPVARDANTMVAAAQALAERTRARAHGRTNGLAA
jgi:hypothetical protein